MKKKHNNKKWQQYNDQPYKYKELELWPFVGIMLAITSITGIAIYTNNIVGFG